MLVEVKYDRSEKKFYFCNPEQGTLSKSMSELQASRTVNTMREMGITVDVRCNSHYMKEGKG